MGYDKVKMTLSGYGRYPVADCAVMRPERYREAMPVAETHCIVRGGGASIGDASLSSNGVVVLMERLNRFVYFDETSGLVGAEGGVTIQELVDVFVPKGWFPPIVPATKRATLGGCLATDVVGENQCADGSFSSCVHDFELVTASGERLKVSRDAHPEIFWATTGALGLTGIVAAVAIQLKPITTAYMVGTYEAAKNFEDLVAKLEGSTAPYTAAWLDVFAKGMQFGRGVVRVGDHAVAQDIPKKIQRPLCLRSRRTLPVPFDMPTWFYNPYTLRAMNSVYYWAKGRHKKKFVVDVDRFFFPLDAVPAWHRLLGRRGFVRYRAALPTAQGLYELLMAITMSGKASWLAAVQRLSNAGDSMLAFPMPGFAMSVDIPFGDGVKAFLDTLDAIVVRHGGKVSIADDSRMNAETFRSMYPRFSDWRKVKKSVDPDNVFYSDLSRRLRLGGDDA